MSPAQLMKWKSCCPPIWPRSRQHLQHHAEKNCRIYSSISHSTFQSIICVWQGSQWQMLTPIFKSGDLSSVNNYRPASLLMLVSQVLERIVHQFQNHLPTHRLLSKWQFGFRSGSSTQEALLSVTNDWHQYLSKSHQGGAVFSDIKICTSLSNSFILEESRSVFYNSAFWRGTSLPKYLPPTQYLNCINK